MQHNPDVFEILAYHDGVIERENAMLEAVLLRDRSRFTCIATAEDGSNPELCGETSDQATCVSGRAIEERTHFGLIRHYARDQIGKGAADRRHEILPLDHAWLRVFRRCDALKRVDDRRIKFPAAL